MDDRFDPRMRRSRRSGKEKSCGKKIKFLSEYTATNFAILLNLKGTHPYKMMAYPCYWCGDWHVGRE